MFGLVAVGTASALAAASGIAEAAPALAIPPGLPGASPLTTDALFRPAQDEAAVEDVQWGPRCWINRWGRRVCRGGVYRRPWGRRRVCWWRYGRRYCAWR